MKTPEFVQRLFVEGTTAERMGDRAIVHRWAEKLAAKMPTRPQDRQMYVANLLRDTLRGKTDEDTFIEFIKITNSWMELGNVAPRIIREFKR